MTDRTDGLGAEDDAPLVTIAIPTWNRAQLVVRAVRSAIAQTYRRIEIVVSDNGSSDDTLERLGALADPRLVVLAQPENRGSLANLNACLDRARGEYLLVLSDDDTLEPAAIAELVRPLRYGVAGTPAAAIGLVWCPAPVVDVTGALLWTTRPGPAIEDSVTFLVESFAVPRSPRLCSILIRTADVRAVGGYQQHHRLLCDLGNWAHVALRYANVACVPKPLAHYAMHLGSESSTSNGAQWQAWGEHIAAELVAEVRERRGEADAARLRRACDDLISNLLATVIMQGARRPGWARYVLSEAIRGRRYLFTRRVLARFAKHGYKLLRLIGRRSRAAAGSLR